MTNAVKKGSVSTPNTGIASVNIAVGSDIAEGDWIIAAVMWSSTSTTITMPSGWDVLLAPVAMGTRQVALYKRKRGTETGTTYTVTFSTTVAAITRSFYGSGNTPVSDITAGSFTKRASNVTTLTIPAYTPPKPGLALLFVGEASAATTNEPAGFSISGTDWANQVVGQMSDQVNTFITWEKSVTSTATIPEATFTAPNGSANAGTVVVHIPHVIDAVADLTLNIAGSNGTTLVPTTAKLWDGSALKPLKKAIHVQKGKSVSALANATPSKPFLIAHRTGSIDWAEATAMGATQSMVYGMDALEAPVARTSDGVYFLLHDQTINRTSPSAPTATNASSLTWAQVQAYNVTVGNAAGLGAQPYYKLTDLLATFGGKVLIFVDPKLIGGANFTEFINILKTVPNYQQWIMGKYYCTATNVADLFHDAGMKAWGYGYTADLDSGAFDTTFFRWDYIGIEYGADNAHWQKLADYGTPMIGHICPDTAAVQACTSRGAIGAMVSGVVKVKTGQ